MWPNSVRYTLVVGNRDSKKRYIRSKQIFTNVLIFEVAQYRCAIRCEQTEEILPMASTLRLPGQPRILEGFFNLGGSLIPVISARELFGCPPTPFQKHTPVIIAKSSNGTVGLCVDRVVEVGRMDSSLLTALPENHSLNNCAEAGFTSGETDVVLLNLDQLLLSEERHRVDELRAQARGRLAEIEAKRQ